MTTPIEHLQSTLKGLGLTAVEARLENLLEQAAKNEPSMPISFRTFSAVKWTLGVAAICEPVCN